jgi:uncharacterized protein (DUF433 family)
MKISYLSVVVYFKEATLLINGADKVFVCNRLFYFRSLSFKKILIVFSLFFNFCSNLPLNMYPNLCKGKIRGIPSLGSLIVLIIKKMSDLLSRITSKPGLCGGRPTVRGMRIRVTDVLDLLSNGLSFEQILEELPYLERADIQACLVYAAKKIDYPVFHDAA